MSEDQAVIEILKNAIQTHKPIEFEYLQQGEPTGVRVGNPHAVFEDTDSNRMENVYLHLVQTDGVSKTIAEFPQWRKFFVNKINNIKVLDTEPTFTIDPGYNPFSTMYSRAIIKI